MADTSLPPGPALPAWAQTLAILLAPDRFLTAAHARHGDVFTVRTAAFGTFVVVAGADAVREVFTGAPAVLRAGESNAPLSVLVGERSVLVLDGPEHLRQRKLLLPPFHGERLRGAEAHIARATRREVEGWPLGRGFPVLPSMQAITLEVVVRVVFGVRGASRGEELSAALRQVLEPMGGRLRAVIGILAGEGPGGGPDAERFARRRAAVDALLFAEIGRRRRAPDLATRDDVLSMLLLARDEDGEGMSDQEVRDELVTILLAGHETTATGLAWALERLVRHPAVLREVLRELDAGGHDYLDAVVKETLRVRPVLPNVGRVLAEEHELFGHRLPAGTGVLPSITLLHRNAVAFPAAEEFRPERFLGQSPSGYAWIPFGGGVRRCLGASFALLEMRVVLQSVLRELELRPARRAGESVVRRGITLTPGDGARVVARERRTLRRGSPTIATSLLPEAAPTAAA